LGNEAITVSQATASDYTAVFDLLESARQWLISRGITRQWPTSIPSEILSERIARGVVYTAGAGTLHKIVGTFTILWADPNTWGEQPPNAGYVHSLAVDRAWAGQGLGEYLLKEAARIVAGSGRKYLRLDCWADNAALCAYYESLGFLSRGLHTWPAIEELHLSEFTVHRYERQI
jgi:ribosomal protein S18 acetylase RimI-like enzyme